MDMNEKNNIESLMKDCKELGIINIQAAGNLTLDFATEAVQAVKDINIDFTSLAKKKAEQQNRHRI